MSVLQTHQTTSCHGRESMQPRITCRNYLFPLCALPERIFALFLDVKEMLHNSSLPAAPLLRTAILDTLGIPEWFFQSCYREDIASSLRRNSWKLAVLLYSICPLCATLHGHCAVIYTATLTWVVWHLVYISSWLTRNLGNCRRLLALPRLVISLMLLLVSVHFFSLLLLAPLNC